MSDSNLNSMLIGMNVGMLANNNDSYMYEMMRRQENQMQLAQLNERAAQIERTTGIAPQGYFAFESAHPTPRQHSPWGPLLLGVLGGVLGAMLGGGALVILAGLAVGGGLGFILPEGKSFQYARSMHKYDAYLSQLEAQGPSFGRSRTVQFDQEVSPHHFTQDLADERAQAAAAEMGRG